MCGIIGYVGAKPASPILMEGLERLEYRGYDSAGIALITQEGRLGVKKSTGKLQRLKEALEAAPLLGSVGIGHTRWATHGRPSEVNAHPHLDCKGETAVIHNGIIENYRRLQDQLLAEGHHFVSETDTEVLPHLIEKHLAQGHDLPGAVCRLMAEVEGALAMVALSTREPQKLVAARLGNAGGVAVGYGEGEMFVASDLPALLPHTRRVAFLASGEIAVLSSEGATFLGAEGQSLRKVPQRVPYDPIAAAKGGYKHFMLKEIMEQPEAVLDTLRGRLGFGAPGVQLAELPYSEAELRGLQKVALVACGTSWHAALVGKFLLEELARLLVEVDYGSEFRYRDALIGPDTLFIAITQSGETVDTLAAMEAARARGARQLTICNVVGSQATRLAEGVLYTRAGPEIGVASTKAFTTQLVVLALLAAHLGRVRGVLAEPRLAELVEGLTRLPHLMGDVLAQGERLEALAHQFYRPSHFLYLGRGINYPIALEGALKLKEISYIHAEGYPAGEMKHGPIALIDENMPVVAIAVRDRVHSKVLGNIEEVKARDGVVIALATEGDEEVSRRADHVIYLPQLDPLLTPVLTVLPLQLLAYHIAVRRGCDVDQPRNLAKSVTVE